MTSKLFLFALVSLFCFQAFAAVQGTLYTLSNNRYLELVSKLKSNEYSDQMIRGLRRATDTYGFTCTQAWGLLESFWNDGDKLMGLNIIKNNIVNPNNTISEIIEKFNSTEDQTIAKGILANIEAAKTIANPNDPVPIYEPLLENKWENEEFMGLINLMGVLPNSIHKIEIAEASIMSATEDLIPEQAMMLFNTLSDYKDILTLKSIINDRMIGITCEQMTTLLKRFSLENQRTNLLEAFKCVNSTSCSFNDALLSLSELIHESLIGKGNLSSIAEKFVFEDQMLTLLEGFSTSILDIENQLTILDAFVNKEKARKVLENSKINSYLFGAPSTKSYFILSDFSGMRTSFKINSTHSLNRLDFMRNEFYRVINTFNDSMQFGCMIYTDSYSRWTASSNMYYATRSNIQDASKHVNSQSSTSSPSTKTDPHQALQLVMANTDIENIYLISSGYPTSGKTDFKEIIADVKKWSNGKIKVNTIALLLGTSNVDNKTLTKSFMKGLADATGGTYRAFESDA